MDQTAHTAAQQLLGKYTQLFSFEKGMGPLAWSISKPGVG